MNVNPLFEQLHFISSILIALALQNILHYFSGVWEQLSKYIQIWSKDL